VPLFGRGAGSPSNTIWPGAEAYLHTKWHIDPSSRLATTDMGRKLGAVPLSWGSWVPIQHTVAGAKAYFHAKFHLDPSNRLPTIAYTLRSQRDRQDIGPTVYRANRFSSTVFKTACPMLSDRCLSVCKVGVLWPNGWTDQDKTWQAGRPRHLPHCVRRGPSSPSPKGAQPPIFGP